LGEAVDAEGVSDEGGEDAEEEAVGDCGCWVSWGQRMRVGRGEGGELTASESGDGEEEMGVLDSGAADLGGEEEDGACEDAPVA
jgi:hypothetical protein